MNTAETISAPPAWRPLAAEWERACAAVRLSFDAAARAQVFRDRQSVLAERHLERVAAIDLNRLSFADACKAFASDLSRHDQRTTLLDQICGENLAPKTPPTPANRFKPTMKATDPQSDTEHQRLAMIPFVQNQPFQNGVSKRHKKYQKVTKSPIRHFQRPSVLWRVFYLTPDIGHFAVKTGS